MKKQRCLILIDGSNFYFKLKKLLPKTLTLDYNAFLKNICKTQKLTQAYYYIGRVKSDGTDKSKQMVANQQRLFSQLRKANIKYKLGYLMKNNGVYHEKGVDVQIAVDMVVAAYENTCDRIILISSDTDLLPAIEIAKSKGKIVEYVGFSHKPSIAMVAHCTESTLLKADDLPVLNSSATL